MAGRLRAPANICTSVSCSPSQWLVWTYAAPLVISRVRNWLGHTLRSRATHVERGPARLFAMIINSMPCPLLLLLLLEVSLLIVHPLLLWLIVEHVAAPIPGTLISTTHGE
jgi:hypothetical protein